MLKRWLSGALATTMLLTGANVFADSVENDIQIVNYKDGEETYQEYVPGRYANQDSPAVPPSITEIDDTIDPEAYDNFERAGLLTSDGNFDWEAYGALPTLDKEADTYDVIGSDDRVSVGVVDDPPYYYTAYLLMEYIDASGNSNLYRGTGFIAGEGVIATAGHNIYSHDEDGWADNVTIILQKDNDNNPYGTTVKTQLRSNTGWTKRQETKNDWGLIETAKDLSDYVGYCGIVNPDIDVVGETMELPGYPANVRGETDSYEMWTDTGTVLKQNADNEVYYDADTSGGNSGSGVFINTSSAIAIHAYGRGSSNSGARIQGLLYEMLQEYRH